MQAAKLLTTIILSCILFSLNAQSDWQLEKNIDGIKVYLRQSETSPVKELRMELEVNASLSTIIATMNDVDSYTKWVYATSEAREVERFNDFDMVYYTVSDFPWPMSDRDLVLRSTFQQNPDTKIITTQSTVIKNKVAKHAERVRIDKAFITWKLIPITPTKTRLEYYLMSDPGGNIPAWLVNLAIDHGPVQTMQAFRKQLKKEKYQYAFFPEIQEIELAKNR